VSDLPTGPIPRVGAARDRRRRPLRAALLVLVTVGLVGGAAYGGAHLLSQGLGGGGADPSGSSSSAAPDTGVLPGAPTPTPQPAAAAATVKGVGYDVSYPQCRSTLPPSAAFGIVGLNGGAPLLSNRCFSTQVAWARRTGAYAVYINTAYSGAGEPVAYGARLAEDAIAREHAAGVSGIGMWWLDVELTNTWKGTQRENATVIASMAHRLQAAGVRVGIYSSPDQWAEIAGDYSPGLPVWNAIGTGTEAQALASCDESFAGSASAIVQWVAKRNGTVIDHNLVCPAYRHRGREILVVR
jgi:hypothetical protein